MDLSFLLASQTPNSKSKTGLNGKTNSINGRSKGMKLPSKQNEVGQK